MDKKKSQKVQKLTLPLGDTIAGPHNVTVEIFGMSDKSDTIPMINDSDMIEEFGYGTAKDAGTENYEDN